MGVGVELPAGTGWAKLRNNRLKSSCERSSGIWRSISWNKQSPGFRPNSTPIKS